MTRTVEWTIPEAGKYQLACHIEGHYEAGMTTSFTAEAAAAPLRRAGRQPAAAPAAAPVEQLPKTAGEDYGWPIAVAVLALLALVEACCCAAARPNNVARFVGAVPFAVRRGQGLSRIVHIGRSQA